MKNIKLILTVAVAVTMLPLGARAAAMEVDPAAQATQTAAQEEAQYTAGTKAMDEQRWADAVTAFDQVATAKGKHADAAIYWKAYSLDKLGRKDEAQSTCESLRQQLPQSAWIKECVVLRARGSAADAREIAEKVRQEERSKFRVERGTSSIPGGVIVIGPNGERAFKSTPRVTSEDDIKLVAISSLMQQEPAKALPLLHDMILSDKPIEVRRQALFVLSRSKDPQAQSMLMDVATNSKDAALQVEAIQVLAIRSKDSGPTLVQIYRGANDAKVKRVALNGLFLAHDAARLVDLARGEKDLNMKRDIVSQLALMHDPVATAYMEELLK